ncbi:MAG: peptidase domain-containing ABC transporter [Bacteroidota bacterium]
MNKKILVKQRDITDCGAACLASVGAYYDFKMPISRIRQIAGTDKKGTNALGMVEAAEKMGFSAKGVRGEVSAIPKIPTPAIAHVIIKNVLQHYVVVFKTSEKEVQFMDPATGKLEVSSIKNFEAIWSGVLILMTPNERFQKADKTVSISSRFWFLLASHKATIIQSIVGAIVFTLIGLTSAIYVQKIIDFVLPTGNTNLLNLLSVGMLVLLAVQLLVNIFKSIFILKTGQQLDAKLILGYYKHLLSLPQRFFDTMRVGEIISRINDAIKIRAFINEVGIDIIINCFVLLFSLGLMFTYYWKLAIIILIVIPLYGLIYFISNRLNKKVERKIMENAAELESQLVESLNGIKTIKLFGMSEVANLKTEVRFVNLLTSVYKSGMNSIFSGNAGLLVSRAFTIIMLWVGARFVLNQQITAGELMSFYAIIGYFTGPVSSLIGANKSYQNAKIAADRLFEIMDLDGGDNEGKLTIQKSELGDIKLENIKFRYGTRVNVFEDFTLNIKKGEITTIAGESGSGKSTIAAILSGLYLVESGRVMLGNYSLDQIKEDALQQLIGIVPQQVDLFAGSIIENVALGEFEPDTAKIMALAEQTGSLKFINELPGGINTQLGEHGLNLSGGQRQRLAIMRALYKDPEVIILDEATSALDIQAERRILSLVNNLKIAGKTIISISHRISSAETADRVVLLEKGKIVADGHHSDLMGSSLRYHKFWKETHAISEL